MRLVNVLRKRLKNVLLKLQIILSILLKIKNICIHLIKRVTKLLFLQIVSLMLRDQKPEVLASASVQRSIEEKERDVNELMAVRRKESEARQEKIRKLTAAR